MAPKLQRRERPDRSAETAKRQKQRRAAAAHGQRPDRSAETAKRQEQRRARAKAKKEEQAAAAEKEAQRQAKAAAELQAAALRAVQAAADKANWAKRKAAKMARRRRGCRPLPGDDLVSSEEPQCGAPPKREASPQAKFATTPQRHPTGRFRGCSLLF